MIWRVILFWLLGSSLTLADYTRSLDLSASLQGAGGIGGLLARTDTNGTTCYHSDGSGNVTSLIDSNGNVGARYMYDGYGRLIGMWGPLAAANVYRFSSREYDAVTGLYYFGHRYYDPVLQRWLNSDPIGERGGFNLYGFVGNNPVNRIDPFGLQEGGDEDIDVEEDIPLFRYYPKGTMPEKEWEREYHYLRNHTHPLGEQELRSWNPEEEETLWDKVVDFFSKKTLRTGPTPNLWGNRGDPCSQQTTAKVMKDLDTAGFKDIDQEVRFAKGPLGVKDRFADIVGVNPQTGEALIINIGNLTQSGVPIMRERMALDDIIFSTTIVNYPQSRVLFIEKGASGLPPGL